MCLALLTLALAYAVVTHGGGALPDSNVTLLVVALAGIVGSFRISSKHPVSQAERLLIVPLLLLPAYLALQVVPLPLPILRILSPTRGEITDALAGVVAASPQFAPLSIAPAGTWIHLARMLGYGLILLLVRQAVRDRDRSPWFAVVPLIVVGGLEAVWGVTRVVPEGSSTVGTYFNRNHFAGLLEMSLPLALMCGISTLRRGDRGGLGAARAVTACALFAVAGVICVAIASSFSKLGFVSTLGSLFVMGVMGFGRQLSAGKRWALAGSLALLVLAAVVFLSPAELVRGFGTVATEQSTENRLPVWKDTVHLAGAYPLFGIGAGNFFPALLRYQNAAPDLAWTHAHNDYLQWLSELGVVGWVIGGVLLCAVFGRAVRGALSERTPERRFLALACTGSLTAILIHSLGDFNTYVLANGMVLSWISGVAAGLAASDTRIQSPQSRSVRLGNRYVVSAGWLLGTYAIASLLSIHSYQDNVKAERAFCTVGICDTDAALAALRRQSGAATNDALQPDHLLAYLPRDPAAPYRWVELGAAMQRAARPEEARYCFDRAVTLAPNSPTTLLMAADFHLRAGDVGRGLELISHSLQAGPTFDYAAFATLDDSHISIDDVLGHVVTDRRSAQAYVRWLIATNNVTDAAKAWEWSIAHGYADDKVAIEYVEFLLRKEMPEVAAKGWGLYTAGRSPGYPDANRIFNGGFETDPSGCRFDWRIDKSRTGVAVGFDSEVRHSGARSLRLRFDGTENVSDVGVEQWVYLKPGQYSLTAYIRTENVTTDEGLAFKVASPRSEAELSFTTDAIRGTRDWTLLTGTFVAPTGGTLMRVLPVRKRSLKFDNLVRGTVWVDGLAITPDAP